MLIAALASTAHAAPPTSRLSVTVTSAYRPQQVLAVVAKPELDADAAGASEVTLSGAIRIEQEKILIELIKNTPASEIDELSDYRFRLGELYAKQVVQQRRADPNSPKLADLVTKMRSTFDPLVGNSVYRNYPKLDMVLFIYGYAIQAIDPQVARAQFTKLLKDYPNSKHVPDAYLSFADNAYDRNQLADAENYYKQVLKFPKAKAYWYAQYKMGYLHMESARYQEALEMFFQVGVALKNETARQQLFAASLRGFTRAYAEIGKADKAFLAFERLDKASAPLMGTELAMIYADKGQHGHAAWIYQTMIGAQPDNDNVCAWRLGLAKASIAETPKGTQQVTVCNADVGVFGVWGKQNGIDVK